MASARRSWLSSDDRLREVGIDGVELLDRGEVRGFALSDQRAFGDERAADASADRRLDRGVVEVEPGARDVGAPRGDIGAGLMQRSDGGLVLRLRHRPRGDQRLLTLGVLGFLIQHGDRLGERGLGGVEFDFVVRGIEVVEHLAGADFAALLERAGDHDARHAGAHVGDAGRRDAARQLAHVRARRRLQRHDADVLRCGCLRGRGRGAFGAGGYAESQKHGGEREEQTARRQFGGHQSLSRTSTLQDFRGNIPNRQDAEAFLTIHSCT